MIRRTTPLLSLGLGLMLFSSPLLFAQVTEENANPAHEKTKSEAESFYKQGNYQKTIELTSEVLKENPKDDVAYYLRGSARIDLGFRSHNAQMVRDGIADAREAIGLNGQKHTDYYLPYLYGMTSLAQLEGRQEHADVALQVATQVLKLPNVNDDQKANVLFHRGRTKATIGKHAEAAEDFEQALSFNSMHMGSFLGAAHAYAAAGEASKAERQFNRAIQAFPNNPIVYNDRGMFFKQQKQYDQALADFTRVIELKNDAYYAYTNRGYTLLEQGDAEAAENDFDRSLAIMANQPMVYSFRGTARLEQGKLSEATADYRKVVELDPKNPLAKADLGFALFFQEQYAAAVQQFEAATKANEELTHLYPWYVVALRRSQPRANVQEIFAPILDNDTEKWDWGDQLLAYLLGRLNEEQLLAATQGDDAEVSKAQKCEAHFFIAQKSVIEGNNQQAVEHFRKALDTEVKHLSAYRGSELALKRMNVATSPRNLR